MTALKQKNTVGHHEVVQEVAISKLVQNYVNDLFKSFAQHRKKNDGMVVEKVVCRHPINFVTNTEHATRAASHSCQRINAWPSTF